jgi:HK97 gp10 family phage protein
MPKGDAVISARAQFTPRSSTGQFINAFISPAVVASVQASLDMVENAAKGYCPVDTGALRDSITSEISTSGKTVVGKVGPHMPYADYVEYGTGRRGDPGAPYGHVMSWPGMVAKPYMRPAFDESKGKIVDLFGAQIGASIA